MKPSRRAFLAGLLLPLPARAAGNVLGTFTTSFAKDAEHKARASNIALAAEAIDGKTIAPGGTLSFNEAVGERTAAFGYAKSVVLRDGMLAEGSGGGTCQVASTLHAAALLAGLEIVQRAPHSRPSAYIRMGLDATVAFGSIDLKIKNPLAAAVTVRARAERELVVTIEGTSARPDVTLTSEIVEILATHAVVERDATLKDDAIHLVAHGIPGFRVRRTRQVDGRRDVRIDLYAPVPTVLRTRSGLLPEGAETLDEAAKPAAVQLRPSTVVTLENRGTGSSAGARSSEDPPLRNRE